MTACDFTTSLTTFHHNLIKEKITEIIEQTFYRVNSLYWAGNEKTPLFSLLNNQKYIMYGHVRNALHYLLDTIYIFIIFGSKLYRQIVGISTGSNYVPLDEDFFLFCYERHCMLSLSGHLLDILMTY